MKRLTLFFVLALVCLTTTVQAKNLSRIAAVVNDEIISTYQLEQEVKVALSTQSDKNQLSATQFDSLKASLLEKMINDKLIEQRTKELDLYVDESELSTAIADVQAKNNLTRDTLIQALAAQGMTMENYREKIKKEILRYKLMNREINYKVLVTSGEVRDYFRDHIDEYKVQPKVRVSRISFPMPADASEKQLAALESQVKDVRDQLLAGGDFDQILGQLVNANGGDMGEMVETDMAAPLQTAIKGLEQGDVSEPLQLNNQLHLLQVTFRNPGDINLFDRVKGDIERKLRDEKTDARFKEWQQEIRTNAFVEKRL